jgi:hypothetical protein
MVLLPMLFYLALAVGMFLQLRNWSAPDRDWTEMHRYAVMMGSIVVLMLVGYFFITAGNHTNQLFQGSVSLVTLVLLIFLGRHIYQREHVPLVQVHQE